MTLDSAAVIRGMSVNTMEREFRIREETSEKSMTYVYLDCLKGGPTDLKESVIKCFIAEQGNVPRWLGTIARRI